MHRRRYWVIGLLIAAPLLIGAAVFAAGGDRPVSDDAPVTRPAGDPVTGTISGSVTGPDGRPVAGAAVGVTALDQPAPAVPEIGVLSGPIGGYEWRLHPGRYQVVVRLGDRLTPPQTATVTAGQAARLDFVLP